MLKSLNFRLTRTIVLSTLFTMPTLWVSSASAQEASDPFVRRAISHRQDKKNAEDIFATLHFGSTMGTSTVTSIHGLKDDSGDVIEGAFAIKVVYDWETAFGNNVTTATLFFNKDGYVTDITAKSTSIISRPFDIANGTIQVLGELFIAVARENGSSAKELADLQKLVDAADSKGLLKASMNLKLLAGK